MATSVGGEDSKPLLPPGGTRFSRPRVETQNAETTENAAAASMLKSIQTLSTATDDAAGEAGAVSGNLTTDLEAQICQQLLVAGFVQSYVDFYHLTNRADPTAGEGAKIKKVYTSTDDMIFIRDHLVAAEASRRQGNTTGVYSAYNGLADLYVKHKDWKTAIYFHEKRLEVAQLTSDDRAMMSANHSLGVVYQKIGEFNVARRFHERHEEIAVMYDVLEEVAKANVELYKVYSQIASDYEHEGNSEMALEMYQKCLAATKKYWDRAAEGETNGKIGMLLLHKGDAMGSLAYLRQQSQIATDMSDPEGRCRACSSLALALDMLGQADKALAELTLVQAISEQCGDAMLQAQACKALGTLYSKVGRLDKAVESLQSHFTLIKTLISTSNQQKPATSSNATAATGGGNDSKAREPISAQDLDLARVYVGISKGNLLLGSYVVAVQTDLRSLLDWKLNRSELKTLEQLRKEEMDRDRALKKAPTDSSMGADAEEKTANDSSAEAKETENAEGKENNVNAAEGGASNSSEVADGGLEVENVTAKATTTQAEDGGKEQAADVTKDKPTDVASTEQQSSAPEVKQEPIIEAAATTEQIVPTVTDSEAVHIAPTTSVDMQEPIAAAE